MNRDREAARDLSKRLEKAQEEIARLKRWEKEAISALAPMQEIGKAIGVGLGRSIPEEILPHITKQKRVIAELKEDNQLLRRKIENHIIMSEDFKAEYNLWLDSINEKEG